MPFFFRIAAADDGTKGIFKIDAAADFSQFVGREVKIEEIQPLVNEMLAANLPSALARWQRRPGIVTAHMRVAGRSRVRIDLRTHCTTCALAIAGRAGRAGMSGCFGLPGGFLGSGIHQLFDLHLTGLDRQLQ
ncbi:MAG: hypothetical protein M3Y65_09300 [Pseudomonadota bacterium]|nr:hypothetical protein [Pseudomonadota bacterium]